MCGRALSHGCNAWRILHLSARGRGEGAGHGCGEGAGCFLFPVPPLFLSPLSSFLSLGILSLAGAREYRGARMGAGNREARGEV